MVIGRVLRARAQLDLAGYVPVDFWETARAELETIKPVFLLAEWENRDLHTAAFDASYAWSWNDTMHKIAHGRATPFELKVYYAWNERAWPADVMRMMFVSNHDKNAWEGTEYEQFGDALHAAIVLSVVGDGLPLIYNGQEAGSDKRLEFFTKDVIDWGDEAGPTRDEQGELYRRLFAMKKDHRALWNGRWGARMVRVPNQHEATVLSFVRAHDDDAVFAVFNFGPDEQVVTFGNGPHHGEYVDAFSGERAAFDSSSTLTLPGWGYRVFTR